MRSLKKIKENAFVIYKEGLDTKTRYPTWSDNLTGKKYEKRAFFYQTHKLRKTHINNSEKRDRALHTHCVHNYASNIIHKMLNILILDKNLRKPVSSTRKTTTYIIILHCNQNII